MDNYLQTIIVCKMLDSHNSFIIFKGALPVSLIVYMLFFSPLGCEAHRSTNGVSIL